MTDLARLREAGRVVYDEQGNKLYLFPAEVWEEVVESETIEKPQIERINGVLNSWQNEPGDEDWWAEFRQFLKENPIRFDEHGTDAE